MDIPFRTDIEELKKFGSEAGVVVLFGREVLTTSGHLLTYAPEYSKLSVFPWEGTEARPTPEAVIEHVKLIGGAVIAAHPYCRDDEQSMGDNIFSIKGLSGIESENAVRGKLTNELAAEAAFSMSLPCCGGSDAKRTPDQIGSAATLFKSAIHDEAELVAALLSGEFWPVKIGEYPPAEEPRGNGERINNRGNRPGANDRGYSDRGRGNGGGYGRDNRRGGGGGGGYGRGGRDGRDGRDRGGRPPFRGKPNDNRGR